MARCACNQSMWEAGDKGTGEVHSRPKLLGKNDSSLDYMRSFSQRNKWTNSDRIWWWPFSASSYGRKHHSPERESMNGNKRASREPVHRQESNINPFMKAEAAFRSNPFSKASPVRRVLLGIKIPPYETRRMCSNPSIDPGHFWVSIQRKERLP